MTVRCLALVLLVACGSSSPSAPASRPPSADPAAPIDDSDAAVAYADKQWSRCAALYEAHAAKAPAMQREGLLYNAACCHARDAKPDPAFALLDRAARDGMRSVEHMAVDPDFESLHADPRWAVTIATVTKNRDTWEATLGAPALRRELLALVEEDQRARKAVIGKPVDDALVEVMREIDRKTTAHMKQVIAAHGWPGKSLVGVDGAHSAWLLVQHADADVAFQKQCLALLEKAVAAGEATKHDYAYLYDRVALAENRLQRYGTQFQNGEPRPLEDPANVDARRKAVGLGTMAEYKKQMRATYGPPTTP